MAWGWGRMTDLGPYLEMIPSHNRCKLDEELDDDNDYDRDLIEIAQYITKWEVKLKAPLELTDRDLCRIAQQTDPVLKQ